jgi:hypothetical protein
MIAQQLRVGTGPDAKAQHAGKLKIRTVQATAQVIAYV